MQEQHQKSFAWQHDGQTKKLTYVQRETPVIDEKGLRKTLTAKVFDRYTVKKLDRKKLEAAMDSGDVDPMTVSKHVTMTTSKPYLKYSEGEPLS